MIRRIVPLVLIAVIAFAAGASGIVSRLWHTTDAAAPTAISGHDVAPTTSTQSAPTSAPSTPAGATSLVATPGATAPVATVAPTRTPTAVPSPTAIPTPTAVPTPGAPLSLDQTVSGARLPSGGWTNAAGLSVRVLAQLDQKALRAEVEVRPIGRAFSGKATAAGVIQHGAAAIGVRDLPSGRYHWQARLISAGGPGHWSSFAQGGMGFGVRREPPPAPAVSSPTDPHPWQSYATPTLVFQWSAPADPSGVAGYSYRLDLDPHGSAHTKIRTLAQQATFTLGTGHYYFHVRALDGAGNWGANATFPVHVDVTPPVFTRWRFSGFYFNPSLENLQLSYKITKISHITVGIYNQAGTRIRHIIYPGLKFPGDMELATWDGRDDKGTLVPAGSYTFAIRATDRIGNYKPLAWDGFTVTYKHIEVSLSQQRLQAYDGSRLVLDTLVTTGNKLLPTPTGLFHIMFARHPFTFHSPWPKGSPYYYSPGTVQYALYFHDSGYFIHDASWRAAYGPGSNAQPGAPGGDYTGTHGCINVPQAAMAQLYSWATPGTPVHVIP